MLLGPAILSELAVSCMEARGCRHSCRDSGRAEPRARVGQRVARGNAIVTRSEEPELKMRSLLLLK